MSRFFINRPVTAIVISILIVLVGIVSAQSLPIAQFTDIAPPEIVVTINYVVDYTLAIEIYVAT
jgi:multidrug efflux pump subunit AcrB